MLFSPLAKHCAKGVIWKEAAIGGEERGRESRSDLAYVDPWYRRRMVLRLSWMLFLSSEFAKR